MNFVVGALKHIIGIFTIHISICMTLFAEAQCTVGCNCKKADLIPQMDKSKVIEACVYDLNENRKLCTYLKRYNFDYSHGFQ